jgi:hypothetical protein
MKRDQTDVVLVAAITLWPDPFARLPEVGLRSGAGVDDLAVLEAGHVRNQQIVRGGADLSGDERHHQQGSQGPAHLENPGYCQGSACVKGRETFSPCQGISPP